MDGAPSVLNGNEQRDKENARFLSPLSFFLSSPKRRTFLKRMTRARAGSETSGACD